MSERRRAPAPPLVLSPAALADLREIGDFIAQDDPARALAFVRALRASRCADAAARPLAFPARGDIAPGVRQARCTAATASSSAPCPTACACCASCPAPATSAASTSRRDAAPQAASRHGPGPSLAHGAAPLPHPSHAAGPIFRGRRSARDGRRGAGRVSRDAVRARAGGRAGRPPPRGELGAPAPGAW